MNTLQLINVLVHLLALTAYVLLIGFVLHKDPKALLNRLCALAIAPFAVWTLGDAFFYSATSASNAMLWMNVASFGWCSFPVFLFWFYLAFTRNDRLLRNRIFIILCLLAAAFFIYLQWAGYLIIDFIRQPYGWDTVWAGSAPTLLFSVYYLLISCACIYLAYNFERKTNKSYEKKQARLLYITPIIALILGSMTDVIFPVLKINFVPPVACIIILIWAGGLVYAITRYGLMTLTPSVAAENILSIMTDSLILVGMDGRITSVNRATLNILGYTAKELVNKEVSSIVTAKATDGNALLRQALEQGRIGSRDATYITKNGEKVPVLLSASVVRNKVEEPLGVVITGYDMREYKKMRLNLRQSEEYYQTLVDHALVGIAIHQDGRFIFANERFVDMLGYTLAEFNSLSIAERVHPDERDFVMARTRRRQAGENEPDTYEVRLLKKDGSVLYALVSNAVVVSHPLKSLLHGSHCPPCNGYFITKVFKKISIFV